MTAAELLDALAHAGYTAQQTAPAVRAQFASLVALELGRLLKAQYNTPRLDVDEIRAALTSAGYSAQEVNNAVAAICPPASPFRKEGPAGRFSGDPFDDLKLLTQRPQLVLTQIIIHASDIVDGLKAVYGHFAPSQHGGTGGVAYPVDIAPGDALVKMSGYYGDWCQKTVILQVTLQTRFGKTHGPFGKIAGATNTNSFEFATKTGQILGFHGSDSAYKEWEATGPNASRNPVAGVFHIARYLRTLGVVIKEGG